MKKKETTEEEFEILKDEEVKTPILPIVEMFGNGDLNILKDKINEIISKQQ